VTGEVPGPEGSTMIATTVFPNDPARKFEVDWWDEENHARISSFSIPEKDTAPGGLKIGMSVKEVEALSGAPFTMSGFDWDYGGYADLSGGKLEQLPGGCYPSVRFAPTKQVSADTNIDAVEGDVVVPSSEPLLEKLGVRVESISLGYADTVDEEE
jgi:hypothetical protein